MNVADDVPNAHGEKTRTKKNARCWFTVGHIAHEPPGNVANDKPKPTGATSVAKEALRVYSQWLMKSSAAKWPFQSPKVVVSKLCAPHGARCAG